MASPAIYSAASTPTSVGSPPNIAPAPAPPQMLAIKPMPNQQQQLIMMASQPGTPGSTPGGEISMAGPPMTLGPRKEWVIPPRPKPGRKPATDTPPTKRKAQNRAAQRAFRERRAARVGELEEQLKETEEERLKREGMMKAELDEARAHITKIEMDLRRASDDSQLFHSRAVRAEDMVERVNKEVEALKVEIAYLRNGAKASGTDAVALPPRRRRNPPRSSQQQQSRPPISRTTSQDVKPHPLGCGTCSSTGRCACIEQVTTITTTSCSRCSQDITRCQCLDETLNTFTTSLNASILPETDMKRAFASSSPILSSKRPRISIEDSQPQEIDFTALFSSKPSLGLYQPQKMDYSEMSTSRPPPGETCGFCDGGGFCACAEAAATQARDQAMEMENRLPPLLSEVTPPPSDTDREYAEGYKLPSLHPNHFLHQTNTNPTQAQSQSMLSMSRPQSSAGGQQQQQQQASGSGGCGPNGPGTCKQCQDDPKSGLFCRSLAAIRAKNPEFSGCCGNGGPGGCCKDEKTSAPPPVQRTFSQPASYSRNEDGQSGRGKGDKDGGVGGTSLVPLSCAETYKTLASHKGFDQAASEIGQWLPKLAAAPGRYPGRGAMDIDAASVMSVIKYFDVRFGKERDT